MVLPLAKLSSYLLSISLAEPFPQCPLLKNPVRGFNEMNKSLIQRRTALVVSESFKDARQRSHRQVMAA